MDPGSAIAAAAAAATVGALARAAEKQAAAVAMESPSVELDLQAGIVKPFGAAADKDADVSPAGPASALAPEAQADPVVPAAGNTQRFFLRGLGSLGEHHLRDHFEQFGRVLEAQLVRDKKTQRPRGMAFVTIAPGDEVGIDALVDRVTSAAHTINGIELELQEALPRPQKEAETEVVAEAAPAAAPAAAEPEPLEPEAQAQAQAQWQMHYLALAINASVPEVSAVPKVAAPVGAVPKAAGYGAAQGGKAGGKSGSRGRAPY